MLLNSREFLTSAFVLKFSPTAICPPCPANSLIINVQIFLGNNLVLCILWHFLPATCSLLYLKAPYQINCIPADMSTCATNCHEERNEGFTCCFRCRKMYLWHTCGWTGEGLYGLQKRSGERGWQKCNILGGCSGLWQVWVPLGSPGLLPTLRPTSAPRWPLLPVSTDQGLKFAFVMGSPSSVCQKHFIIHTSLFQCARSLTVFISQNVQG